MIILTNYTLLGFDFSRVDSVILNGICLKYYPGAQLLIGNNKDIIYYNNYGQFTYNESSPYVDEKSLFDLASLTKVVATTSAIMKLHDEGKLSLDDFVSDYIPDFTSGGKENVRIRNLLLHNSGLKTWFPFYTSCKSMQDIIYSICRMNLEYETGMKYIYSDLNMILLSRIVEKITGLSFDSYCHNEIFEPLGMNNTFFNPDESNRLNCLPTEVDNYWRHHLIQGEVHDENASIMNGVSGHAGLFSNSKDLYTLMKMMLNYGVYEELDRSQVYPVYKNMYKKETVELFILRYKTDKYINTRALGWNTKPVTEENVNPQCGSLMSDNSIGHTGFTGTSIWCD